MDDLRRRADEDPLVDMLMGLASLRGRARSVFDSATVGEGDDGNPPPPPAPDTLVLLGIISVGRRLEALLDAFHPEAARTGSRSPDPTTKASLLR